MYGRPTISLAASIAARTAAGRPRGATAERAEIVTGAGAVAGVTVAPPVGRALAVVVVVVFGCAPPVAASAGAAIASSSTLPHKARAPPRTSITSLVGLRG